MNNNIYSNPKLGHIRPFNPAATDSRTVAGDLAKAFVNQLQANITTDEFAEMRKRNATPDYSDNACASHDFIDANEVMASAFNEITGRDIDCGSDSDCALWSKAWDIAKHEYLTEEA